MMKKLFVISLLGFFFVSCATVPNTQKQPQEVIVKVQAADPAKVTVEEKETQDQINKSMEVPNPEGRLSQLSFVSKDKAFVKIFSGLSVADVTRLWNDLVDRRHDLTLQSIDVDIQLVARLEPNRQLFQNRRLEAGRRHQPEFTMIEFYEAFVDYTALMDRTEELMRGIATDLVGSSRIEYQGETFDFYIVGNDDGSSVCFSKALDEFEKRLLSR